MFADTARPRVNDLLFSRWKSYDGARSVFRYAAANLRKNLDGTMIESGLELADGIEAA